MNIASNMFLAASTAVFLTGEPTKQTEDITVGQTLHLPQVRNGLIVANPSITLYEADGAFCQFEIQPNHARSVKVTVRIAVGSKFNANFEGVLNAEIWCWVEKLSVEYYFQKLELEI